jgi:DnaK suppressor protein
MLKPAEIDQFRKLLVTLKARIRGDVEQLSDEALERGNNGGDSPTHLAELGTASFEQDFSLHLMENDQEVLKEITAAIQRIEDGTYGLCEGCLAEGRPVSKAMIPKLRLKAIPYARNCVACKRKREEMSL